MTQNMSGYPPAPGASPGSGDPRSAGDVVRDEAAGVGGSVKEAGGQVAQAAADQAKDVVAETRQQARDLLREGRHQVREQARTGQYKAADNLAAIADELRQMADAGDRNGVASELAAQGAARLHDFAAWLQKREPGDLLEEVRSWARQRPGTFLLAAAAAGVVAGRLTRGAIAAGQESQEAAASTRTRSASTPMNGGTVAQPGMRAPSGEPYGADFDGGRGPR